MRDGARDQVGAAASGKRRQDAQRAVGEVLLRGGSGRGEGDGRADGGAADDAAAALSAAAAAAKM